MKTSQTLQWLQLLSLAPVLVHSKTTTTATTNGSTVPISIDPGERAVIPYTVESKGARLNASISWDVGNGEKTPSQAIQALNINGTSDLFTKNGVWLGISIDNFDMVLDLQVGLLASGDTINHFDYPLKEVDLGDAEVKDGVVTAHFYLKAIFSLYAEMRSDAPTTFDTGFNVTLRNPAGIVLGLALHTTSMNAKEFHTPFDFKVTPTFSTNDSSPEFSFQIGLRTRLSIQASLGTLPVVEAAAINIDMPAYNTTALQLKGVDYHCTTGVSTPKDQRYANLTKVTQKITYGANWQLGTLFGGKNDTHRLFDPIPIGQPIDSQCLAFDQNSNTQVTAPQFVSNTIAPASKSSSASNEDELRSKKRLSAGGAVGVTIAVELLVVAIAAGLFWLFTARRERHDDTTHSVSLETQARAFKAAIVGFFAAMGLAIKGCIVRKPEGQYSGDGYAPPGQMNEKGGPIITASSIPGHNGSGEGSYYASPQQPSTTSTRNPADGMVPEHGPTISYGDPAGGGEQPLRVQQYQTEQPIVGTTGYHGDGIPWEEPRSR